jgi:predicted  nucleic acid-binding Zn-ribbon protein
MAIAAEILTNLKADTAQFISGITGAQSSMEGFAGTSQKIANVGKVSFLAIGAAAATVATVAIKAANEYEVAHNRLVAAVKAKGDTWTEWGDKVQAADDKLTSLGFKETDTENALIRLVPVTKDAGQATSLMGLAADIARGRHIALMDAVNLLVKVENGRVNLLQRIGINTKDVTGATISSTEAIDRLSKMYGGQGAAYASTFQGRLDVMNASLDKMAVNIGQALLPVMLKMMGLISPLIALVTSNSVALYALAAAASAVAAAMAYWIATLIVDKVISFTGAVISLVKWIANIPGAIADAVRWLNDWSIALTANRDASEAAMLAQIDMQDSANGVIATQEGLTAAEQESLVAMQEQAAAMQELQAEYTALTESEQNQFVVMQELQASYTALVEEEISAGTAAGGMAAEMDTAAASEAAMGAAADGAGVGLIGLVGAAGPVVAGIAAVAAAAYFVGDAFGFWSDSQSKAVTDGEHWTDLLVQAAENTGTTAQKIHTLGQELKDADNAVKPLEASLAKLKDAGVPFVGHQKELDEYYKLSDEIAVLNSRHDSLTKALNREKDAQHTASLEQQIAREENKKLADSTHQTADTLDDLKKSLNSVDTKSFQKAISNLQSAFGPELSSEILSLYRDIDTMNKGIGSEFISAVQQAESASSKFGKSIQSSVQKATDPFTNFAKATSVSESDFLGFIDKTQTDAQAWAGELNSDITLIKTYLPQSMQQTAQQMIQQVASLGPSSKPALDAFTQALGDGSLNARIALMQQTSGMLDDTTSNFSQMAVQAAIQMAEIQAVADAVFAAMSGHGTEKLQELMNSNDTGLSHMATTWYDKYAYGKLQAEQSWESQVASSTTGAAGVIAEAQSMAGGVNSAIYSIPTQHQVDVWVNAHRDELDGLITDLDNLSKAPVQVRVDVLASGAAVASDRNLKHEIVAVP